MYGPARAGQAMRIWKVEWRHHHNPDPTPIYVVSDCLGYVETAWEQETQNKDDPQIKRVSLISSWVLVVEEVPPDEEIH